MKRIRIIEASPGFDAANRFSAISSVLYSIAVIFDKIEYEVDINGEPIKSIERRLDLNGTGAKSSLPASFVRKWVPLFIKNIVRYVRVKRHHKQLLVKCSGLPKADIIFEFNSLYSMVGTRLAAIQHAKCIQFIDAPQIKLYVQMHGHNPIFAGKAGKAELDSIREADLAIFYSNAIASYFLRQIPERIQFTAYQLVDFLRLQYQYKEIDVKSEPIVLGFIGSFLPWHRVDRLITDFERLQSEGVNVRLILIGSGMDFSRIKELASNSPYCDKIELTGFLDGNELKKKIAQMHIGVIPNAVWYQSPVKIFQYTASGLFLVSASTETIHEITDDCPGKVLFNIEEQDGLFWALKSAIEQLGSNRAISKLNSEWVKNKYGEPAAKEFYEKLLKRFINE